VTRDRIFVAYYDSARQLSVASRARRGGEWTRTRLPIHTGWDSHNGIALAVDAGGRLHLVGNLHNDPLIYFRTARPGDIASFVRVPAMVAEADERSMTYPVFLRDARGRLILKYRDGGSGRGREIYNVLEGAAWRRLLGAPLVDGEGRRSAYFVGPTLGPDGRFHLAWVWRDTPDAVTNHDLSYARSRDLVHWERSDGTPLPLPIRFADAEIVDPVPVRGGMINNNSVIGFDAKGRPMITYHKFDAAGGTQIFVARRETGGWRIAQASSWTDFRWDFGGLGSLDSRLTVEGAVPEGAALRVPVMRDGMAIDLLLDPATLRSRGERPGKRLAASVKAPAGMQINTLADPGGSGIAIAWPTLAPNRDQPRAEVPEPTELLLVEPR
jgi:hypothetical protein